MLNTSVRSLRPAHKKVRRDSHAEELRLSVDWPELAQAADAEFHAAMPDLIRWAIFTGCFHLLYSHSTRSGAWTCVGPMILGVLIPTLQMLSIAWRESLSLGRFRKEAGEGFLGWIRLRPPNLEWVVWRFGILGTYTILWIVVLLATVSLSERGVCPG